MAAQKKDSNIIFVNCHACGSKTIITREQRKTGVLCQKCGVELKNISVDGTPQAFEGELGSLIKSKKNSMICPNCNTVVSIKNKKKLLALCFKCGKLFPRSSTPKDNAGEEKEADKPNPAQLELLSMLGIAGTPSSNREANNVLLVLRETAEKVFEGFYPSFKFLPHAMKMETIANLVKSPNFSKFYFGEKNPEMEELAPIIAKSIPDQEIREALTHGILEEQFSDAVEYINEFAQYVYNLIFDKGVAEEMALKAFARGWGSKLETFGSVVYDKHAVTEKKGTDISDKKRWEFYNRPRAKANKLLGEFLKENGYQPQEPEKRGGGGGCLFILLLLSSGIILTILSFAY